MGPSPVWRVPPAAILHWREWDREFVVYHEQSGDTHRLNEVGARVLKLLVEAPATAVDLLARIAADSAAPGAVPASVVDSLLVRFNDLGLIEPHDDHPAGTAASGPR